MAVETQYNVVKVNELREITVAQGVDQLIINDLDSSPLETKKITAENFALSIKDYILPIATEDTLGGIKVGQGLTINPITGVLSNDINRLNDLADVIILNPEANHVLRYNGVQWVNQAEGGFTEIIGGPGLSGGGTEGVIILSANAGAGLSIVNDQITFNAGAGLGFNGDDVDVQVAPGLTITNNQVSLVPGPGVIIQDQAVTLNLNRGLRLTGSQLETALGGGLKYSGDGLNQVNHARGLTILNGGELELLIGNGLKFTDQVLEGNATLTELNDVNIDTPVNGQLIRFNSGTQMWENVGVDTINLNDLGDVVAPMPEEYESLIYDGTNWVPGAPPIAVDPLLYKNTVKARISLTMEDAFPVAPEGGFYDRTYVTSSNIYLHGWDGGKEIGLYSNEAGRWTLVGFEGTPSFSLAPCNQPKTNYDVYVYNSSTDNSPVLAVEFQAWLGDHQPPARSMQDGAYVKSGNPTRRLVGVIRTTTAGNTSYNLGGVSTISDGDGLDSMPHCFIGNLYNTVQVNMFFIFGTAFGPQSSSGPGGSFGWAIPYQYWQANVFPRIGFVNATQEPTRVDHDIACYVSNNHSDACIGINIPESQYRTGHSGVYGHVGGLELWSVRARSSSPYSGATSSGYFDRSFEPGFNEVTYWWDNCGGGIANTLLSHGFNAKIYA